jgi:hypothetical protein
VSTSPARWRPTDAALALAGLDELHAAAFRHRWARDESALPALEAGLLAFAEERAARESWRLVFRKVGGTEITVALRDLVRLALAEEHHAAVIGTIRAKAEILGLHEATWTRHVSDNYSVLRVELETWCSIAHRHIARRLDAE